MTIASTFNVPLGRRQRFITVEDIPGGGPGFIFILDSMGKEHKLFQRDFSPSDWEKIRPGSTIIPTISESVTGCKVQAPKIEEYIRGLILVKTKEVAGPFFIWVCQYCKTDGCVEYNEGDDIKNGAIIRIVLSHRELGVKEGCKYGILIYNHQGVRQIYWEQHLLARINNSIVKV